MRKFVLDPKKLPIEFELGGTTYCGMPENCTTEQNAHQGLWNKTNSAWTRKGR